MQKPDRKSRSKAPRPAILAGSLFRCLAIQAGLVFGAGAASIPGLYNTGVNDQGTLLGSGEVDPHYRLVQSADSSVPGPNAYVVNDGGFPIPPWAANGPSSKWIAPVANQSTGNPPGDYWYRLSFDLTGLDPATAVITGVWSSDNTGTGIRLNGVNTGISNDGDFQVLANTFTLNSGFVEGTNTLDFVVNNGAPNVNPTGLRVEISGTADPWAPPGTPPSILVPPASQSAALGESVSLQVSATGARPLSFQWRLNSAPIPGATHSIYLLAAVRAEDAGSYEVVVSNPWGTVTSAPPAMLSIRYPSPAELSYEPPGPSSRRTGLAITEIMYHPADRADLRNLEFIELYNSNPFPEDLGGYRLTGDWEYTFPEGTKLAGRGYLVVAPSPADMQVVYGIAGVLGGFTNRLPNSGGMLQLVKKSGGVLLEIEYSDQPPWPVAADGAGQSLVLARPSLGENNPKAWAASGLVGGSPGAVDPVPTGLVENVVINEFLAHTDRPQVDYVELYNHSAFPVDISGCILTDDPATNKFVIPSGTTLPAGGFVHYTETELGFALGADGETLYFKNAASTRAIDAVRFDAQENGVASGRWPDGAEEFYRLQAQTPGEPNAEPLVSEVVINELMYHPLSKDDEDQYLELFNRGTTPVNLGGWRLTEGISFTFPTNTTIAPEGYLVVARNRERLLSRYPNLSAAVTLGNFQGRLAHSGERIVLTKPDTLISTSAFGLVETNTIHIPVDEVTYGTGGRWGPWADGGGSSLELVDPRSNHRLAANWADSDESGKSAWTTITTTGVLDLGHPEVPNADQLQLFLLGAGEALVDNVEAFVSGGDNRLPNPGFESGTSGWFFQGTHRLSGLETNGGYGSARSLRLRASGRGNQVVDRVRAPLPSAFSPGQVATIRAQARWLRGWPELLLRFRGGWLEAAGRLNVPTDLGTPGARNSRARPNIGPAIHSVSHHPVLPAANQSIRVIARAEDPDGLQAVWLKYRLDPNTSLTAVQMTDDGANGDQVAGDGIFTGLIPGQAAGTLVAFRIEAIDNASSPASARFPDDAPTRECLVRVGETVPPGAFGTYRIWITQATFDFWSAREKMSSENVDATFVYGTNRVVYNVGTRFAGSPYSAPGYTTPTGALCGYDLDFPPDDTLLGETRVILDWPVRDPTDQREQLMFWFLEQFGLPNNYRRYIHFYVNGVRRGTIYDDVQRPGGDMIEEWFGEDSDGSLFKTDVWDEFDDAGGRIGSAVLLNSLENFTTTGGAKKVARYRWNYEPRSVRGTANDYTELFRLVDAVNAPESGYQSAVEGVVDIDHWMQTFCMNDLASYWDGFGNPNGKNTYLYKPTEGRWKLMSWDFDVGLGVYNDPVDAPLFATLNDPAMMRLEAYPAFARRYWCALDHAVKTFFQTGPGTAIDTLLDAKYAAFQANGIGLAAPDSIKSWISQRRAFLLGQLATVSASFTVSGTNYLKVAANNVVLTGTAPVSMRTLTINGVPWPVTWTTVTSWRLAVPVTNGIQTLVLQGFDWQGQPLAGASRMITVDYSGQNVPPEDALVFNEIMSHPAVPGAEYVELFNRSGSFSFDLSGWRIDGLDYTFPPGSSITNGQFLVLTRDQGAFGAAYGWGIPVAGQYPGRLQPEGQMLTLLRPDASQGEVEVTKVRYEGVAPWPETVNGTGSSLQLLDPSRDPWRVGNWIAVPTNTAVQPTPEWVYFSTVGTASSSALYIYLLSAGELYLDDISLVAGTVPGAGANLIANPGFESPLTSGWARTANFNLSTSSSAEAHSGAASLHIVATAPGTGNGNAIYQNISPGLTIGQPYALSFWYRQSSNTLAPRLIVRLSASGITSGSVDTAMPNEPSRVPWATPGAANTLSATLPAFPPLWLNELQAENLTGITNRAGQPAPWLELYNPGTNTLSLAGLYLANQYTNLSQWEFPADATILPREFKVIFADGETNLSTATELHAGFTLTSGAGCLALSRWRDGEPEILDYINYAGLAPDRSFGSFPDRQSFQRQQFFYPTPGSSNNGAAAPITVFINEWMADNTRTLADPADGGFEDWFELYNPGPHAVDLGGCFLTDTLLNKFQFEVPGGGRYVLPPGGFLLVWADGESQQNSPDRPDLHVDFKLDKQGEGIYLFAADGQAIDAISFGGQTTDVSEGRFVDGGPLVFRMPTPTPGSGNVIPNTAPVLASIPDQIVYPGQLARVTAAATDAESAVQTLAFSLEDGAPAGARIDPVTGLFTWLAANDAAPGTNLVTVRVEDNGTPPLGSVGSFKVIVVRLPELGARLEEGLLRLGFATLPDQNYRVEYRDDLVEGIWLPLTADLPGTGSEIKVDAELAGFQQRYFRVLVQGR